MSNLIETIDVYVNNSDVDTATEKEILNVTKDFSDVRKSFNLVYLANLGDPSYSGVYMKLHISLNTRIAYLQVEYIDKIYLVSMKHRFKEGFNKHGISIDRNGNPFIEFILEGGKILIYSLNYASRIIIAKWKEESAINKENSEVSSNAEEWKVIDVNGSDYRETIRDLDLVYS